MELTAGMCSPGETFGPNALDPHRQPLATGVVRGTRSEPRTRLRRECSDRPGVYGMLDAEGRLIYVGKSCHVRTRLRSYFSPRMADEKPGRILDETATIIWEIAPSEFAALLRELQLIIRYRPRWNVQGQPSRQRLHFICLGRRPVPQAYTSRQLPRAENFVFGPVRGGRRAREVVETLNKLFQLRDCSSRQPLGFADQRTLFALPERPGCLRYEMGTCAGPCIAACTRRQYYARFHAAVAFMRGKDSAPLRQLQAQMQAAAAAQHYERASLLRDQLEGLQWLQTSLQRADAARTSPPQVYEVLSRDGRSLWYLVRDGVIRAVVRRPNSARTAIPALRRLEMLDSSVPHYNSGVPHYAAEDYQQLMFLESWFRLRPAERQHCLRWQTAIAICRRHLGLSKTSADVAPQGPPSPSVMPQLTS